MTTTEEPGQELELRPDAELSPVVDAELVPRPKPEPPTLIGSIVEHPVRTVVRGVITLRESPKARKAVTPVRVTARAGYTTGQGFKSWWSRAVDAATFGKLRRAEAAAEAGNDADLLLKTRAALEKARDNRQARLLRLPLMLGACVALTVGIVAVVWFLLLCGAILVWAFDGGSTWDSWWAGVAVFWDTVGTWGRRLIAWALWAAGPCIVWAAWAEGKRRGAAPRWLVTDDERAEMDSHIDERMISLALANLGISALTKFFADGGHLTYLQWPRVDGEGTYAKVRLCPGVTAAEIAAEKPRRKLAGNLSRSTLETWPTTSETDGENVLELWVADKGVLSKGAGPWPLLGDGTVDAFEGVPIGLSQRGDVLTAPLFETNWLLGGRPGQGKSACMRCLLLGAALDPTVELWAFVFGETPDFKPFQPRLGRYHMGLDDDVFEAGIQALRDLLAEMERRGKVLGQQPGSPPRTSRKLANNPALGLHILVAAFDEVHELFMHPEYGKEAEQLCIRLIRRGRKYGIILMLATQSTIGGAIPPDITRQIGCNVAFSVKDYTANDGLLGTGSYKQGIRATELRYNVDRGTSVTVGITKNTFELIRWFYIVYEDRDGKVVDEVTPVIARAMDGVKELRRTAEPRVVEQAPPDHLKAIWEALRREARVRTAVVLGRLIEADAGLYEPWGFRDLKAALATEGVAVRKYGGDSMVYLEDVQEALSLRDEEEE